MNNTSQVLTQAARLRAIPIDAVVPSTTEISVVQAATVTLFQAARRIWSASSSATYQRSDRPGGGKRSDSDAVNEVIRTISVGATRNTIATTVSAAKTSRSETASQSTACLGACMDLAPPPQRTKYANNDQHRGHEHHRNRRREWPIIGADRLLIDVERHVDQPRAADQRLGHKGGNAGRVGQDAAGDHTRQRQRDGDPPQRLPFAGAERA